MKEKRIEIRLSETEFEELKNKAKVTGVTASEIIRQGIKRVRTWTLADRKTEREKISQIARIGNNLNQIARWCNQNKSTADVIEVTTHLIAIERSLREL